MARKKLERPVRDLFYIITNGKETECNYFTLLKAKKSPYDVKILFDNADPVGLVETARMHLDESNQVWIVFDVDNTYEEGSFSKAVILAERYGVKYAFSNLAFEVWLISHFEKCEKELNTNGHKRILDDYLKSCGCLQEYSKSDEKQLAKFFIPHYRDACTNAKIVYQKRIKNHNELYGENSKPRYWEWNSCTTVFKLVEALKLTVE